MIITRTLVIPAGAMIPITARGNFIRCLESSDPFKVETNTMNGTNDSGGSSFEMERGLGFETIEFSSVNVHNTGTLPNTIKLVISNEGYVEDSRLTINQGIETKSQASDSVNVPPKASISGGAAKAVLGKNDYRKSALIVPDDDTAKIYIGGSVADSPFVYGAFVWESKDELLLQSVPNTNVRILEEVYKGGEVSI